MNQKRMRALDQMPATARVNYCKILGLWTGSQDDQQSPILAELYRLMAYVQLEASERKAVLQFMEEPLVSLEELSEAMFQQMAGQERDMLRFFLMKDALYLDQITSEWTQSQSMLIERLQDILNINLQQKNIFLRELKKERHFQVKKEKGSASSLGNEFIASAIAWGIPLTGISFWGFKKFRDSSKRKRMMGLTLFSCGAYHSVKWVLSRKDRQKAHYRRLVYEQMKEVHNRGIAYLVEDIQNHPYHVGLVGALKVLKKAQPKRI